jgi:Ca2+-binding EF-hand superfamily protein
MVMSGFAPFVGRTAGELMTEILRHDKHTLFHNNASFWASVSGEAKDFITSLLCSDESKRLTAAQALCHPWVQRVRGRYLYTVEAEVQERLLLGKSGRTAVNNLLSFNHASIDRPSPLLQAATVLLVCQQCRSADDKDLESAKVVFYYLNSSQNGALNRDELKAGLMRLLPPEGGLDETDVSIVVNNIFQSFLCGDGYALQATVSYSDFLAVAMGDSILHREDNLRLAFEVFSGGTGFITLQTLKSAIRLEDDMVVSMFREANLDGTGIISFPDFEQLLARHSTMKLSVPEISMPSWRSASAYARSSFALLRKCILERHASSGNNKREIEGATGSRKKGKQSNSWRQNAVTLDENSSHTQITSAESFSSMEDERFFEYHLVV